MLRSLHLEWKIMPGRTIRFTSTGLECIRVAIREVKMEIPDDMSVERCTATSGSSGTLFCEYVNADRAPAKRVEWGGCWR